MRILAEYNAILCLVGSTTKTLHQAFARQNLYPVQQAHHLKVGGRIHIIHVTIAAGFFLTALLFHQSEGMGRLALFEKKQ